LLNANEHLMPLAVVHESEAWRLLSPLHSGLANGLIVGYLPKKMYHSFIRSVDDALSNFAWNLGALVLNTPLKVLRFTILPLILLLAPLCVCQTTHTVTVGSNACNGGLSFVDADSGGCSNQSTVKAGDTINWVWGDNAMPHSATSGTCVGEVCQTTPFWDSGEFVTGGGHTFSRVMNNPGVFPYFCTVHDSNMVGTVRVVPTPATFGPATSIPVGTNPFAIVAGDFNKDGNLDLAVANRGDNTVSILLGNGDGTFAPSAVITGFNGPASIAVADFNNDGKLDLAVANSFDNLGNASVTILQGNGDGTFVVKGPFAVGTYPQALIAADFDGDGKMDLAVAIAPLTLPVTTNNVIVLRGNGNGTFTLLPPLSTNALTPDSLAAFDFNKDGKPDLAVVNSGGGISGNRFSIFLNTSSGPGAISFMGAINYITGLTPHGIVAGVFTDAQGNPTPGVAVPNAGTNTVGVFLADSGGNFTAVTGSPFTVGNTASPVPIAVAAADLNGDGYLDLAVANNGRTPPNNSESTVTTLMNDAAGSFNSFITTTSETNSAPRDIAVGDFNGDGRPDLALANFSTNDVSILLSSTAPFPPAAAGAATHLGISVQSAGPVTPEGNPSTTAGVSFQITVTAYDAYQKVATGSTGYRGTVQFASSDGNAVLPGNYTFTNVDNGVHTFTVTLKTADPAPAFQVFIVQDRDFPAIKGRSSDILVHPAAATTFTLSAPSTAIAGTPFNFTVTARDTFGNRASGYGGTVNFSSSDAGGCVNLPGSSGLTNGVGTFIAQLVTTGNQTLTATDSVTSSITGTSSAIGVTPGTLHFLVTPSFTSRAVGQPVDITVTAVDTCNNPQSYTSTPGHPVHFTSSDGSASLPADYLFVLGDNGSHTFTGVTFSQAGTQSVTASDEFNQFFGSSNISVTPGATTVSLAINPALPAQILFRKSAVLTATVNVTLPAAGVCTGTVTFFDGATQLGNGNVSGNQAVFTTTTQFKLGKHSFTAVYNGDANFTASPHSAPVVQYRSPRPR
jgi:hypothetical protein